MNTRAPATDPDSEYGKLFTANNGERAAQVIMLELFGKGGTAVALAALLVSVGLSAAAYQQGQSNMIGMRQQAETFAAQKDALEARLELAQTLAQSAERQAEMLKYYVNEVDGKLIAGRFIKPEDSFAAKQSGIKEKTK